MPLADQQNHEISIVEVGGTQKSADLLWDNSKITYWGVYNSNVKTGFFDSIWTPMRRLTLQTGMNLVG
jgi:hypothetical protein